METYRTLDERQEEFYQKQYKRIANGLNDFLAREHLKKIDLCKTLGLHHASVHKLLDAEPVSLDMVRLFKLIHLAGYKIVPNKKEEEK